MKLLETELDGCYSVTPFTANDNRGKFVKTYNYDMFAKLGMPTDWKEEYLSYSKKGVIRGMHFQTPPHDHDKLVFCLHGRALDVVLDLRTKSFTYGKYFKLILEGGNNKGLYVPRGFAHGFLALDDDTIMQYKVNSVYAPEADMGLRWDSFGLDWGISDPILSRRDLEHPTFMDFESPFEL